MNTHTKAPRIATIDGIFVLGSDGFYAPEREEETRWPLWAGLLPVTLVAFGLFAWGTWYLFA